MEENTCNNCNSPVDEETTYCQNCVDKSWLLQIISEEDFALRVQSNSMMMSQILDNMIWHDNEAHRRENIPIPQKKKEKRVFQRERMIAKLFMTLERLHPIEDVKKLESAIMKVVNRSKVVRSYKSMEDYRKSIVLNLFSYDMLFEKE